MKNYIDADRLKEQIENRRREKVKQGKENELCYYVAYGLELAEDIIDQLLKESLAR